MDYTVLHETRYTYSSPVTVSQQLLHLKPRSLPRQVLHAWALEAEPGPAERREDVDYFGNPVTQITLATSHQALSVAKNPP